MIKVMEHLSYEEGLRVGVVQSGESFGETLLYPFST